MTMPTNSSVTADARAASRPSEELSPRDIRRNMICCIMLDAIFSTGYADLMLALQPLLVYLKASNFLIGIITGAGWAGLLGVFLSPWITRHFRYKKIYMIIAHVPYLAPLGICGLGILHAHSLGFTSPKLLTFVLCMFLAHNFFAGFVSLPHQEYVASVIPMSYRGRYTGFSFSIGGLTSVLAALAGGYILLHVPKPMAYGYVFIISWAIIQSGYIAALFAKERPTPIECSPKPWSRTMFTAFWHDKSFVKVMVLNAAIWMLVLPVYSFVNIYGFKELHMAPATSAVMQIVAQVARVGLSFIVGIIIDRIGPRRMIPAWMLVAVIALLPPVLIPNQYGVYASIALSTIFWAGAASAFTALSYGLPKPENRAGNYTIMNMCMYLTGSIGPLLTGKLCDVFPYKTVFIIIALVAIGFIFISKSLLKGLSDKATDYA